MATKVFPKTLQEAIVHFSDEDTCVEFVRQMRWPDGKPQCPLCNSQKSHYIETRRVWRCKECGKQYSVKKGTIFEQSPIPLSKWLAAMWMIAGAKNGISSYEIHRALGVTQKSAWFMMHRIRLALHAGSVEKNLFGEIEADETFIGGLSRNMHKERRAQVIKGSPNSGKAVVFGLLERSTEKTKSKVRVSHVPDRKKATLQPIIKDNVERGSAVYTDEHLGYDGLTEEQYRHAFVNHAETYVRGKVHTNGMENFWTLLKRTIKGTYVSVEPFHLYRYLDEQAFRFNEREGDDCSRFLGLVEGIVGRRLTWNELTGKAGGAVPVQA